MNSGRKKPRGPGIPFLAVPLLTWPIIRIMDLIVCYGISLRLFADISTTVGLLVKLLKGYLSVPAVKCRSDTDINRPVSHFGNTDHLDILEKTCR